MWRCFCSRSQYRRTRITLKHTHSENKRKQQPLLPVDSAAIEYHELKLISKYHPSWAFEIDTAPSDGCEFQVLLASRLRKPNSEQLNSDWYLRDQLGVPKAFPWGRLPRQEGYRDLSNHENPPNFRPGFRLKQLFSKITWRILIS